MEMDRIMRALIDGTRTDIDAVVAHLDEHRQTLDELVDAYLVGREIRHEVKTNSTFGTEWANVWAGDHLLGAIYAEQTSAGKRWKAAPAFGSQWFAYDDLDKAAEWYARETVKDRLISEAHQWAVERQRIEQA